MRERISRQLAGDRGQDLSYGFHPRRLTVPCPLSPIPSRRQAFTLTELLIVIAIIAVLAALATAAAVNALRAANRGRITLAIQGVSRAVEDFKTQHGAYPPNGMAPPSVAGLVRNDFVRMFNKAFPRHKEPREVIEAIAGVQPTSAVYLVGDPLELGLRANEALFFWLGGFSADEEYPLSGTGGPAFVPAGDGEILESRNRGYEFDLAQLGPKNDAGAFDGRLIQYKDPRDDSVIRQINFWTFTPKGSASPLVYFDVSRYKPEQYDAWAADPQPPESAPWIVAFKQLRQGKTGAPSVPADIVFVNQGKYQIFHPGLDDDWGSDSFQAMSTNVNDLSATLYPAGPFIGPISDTLTNFTDGTLADATGQ